MNHLDEALVKLNLDPSKVCIVSDIGCIGILDAQFATPHTLHTTHGRSTAFATGIELVMRTITVAMLGTIVWYSLPILELSSSKTVLSTGLSEIWTYLPLMIGAVLMIGNELVRMAMAATGHIPVEDDDASLHSAM